MFAENGCITPDVLTHHGNIQSGSSPDLREQADGKPAPSARKEPATMREAVERTELDLLKKTMDKHKGNKKRVAEELGISRSYIYKLLGEQESE